MRVTTIAIVLAATVPVGSAQAFYCSRPSEPYIRSAYSSDFDQMERTRREVDEYVNEMNQYLSCLADENADASSEADNVIDEWNRTVRNFNNQQ